MLDFWITWFRGLNEVIVENLPDTPEPCTKNIMCQRYGARHKRDCIGKTINIDTYVRELKRI